MSTYCQKGSVLWAKVKMKLALKKVACGSRKLDDYFDYTMSSNSKFVMISFDVLLTQLNFDTVNAFTLQLLKCLLVAVQHHQCIRLGNDGSWQLNWKMSRGLIDLGC